MTDLYPEPPHLSAFVVPELNPWTALGLGWEVLVAAGCVFTGNVLVGREPGLFRDVSDVEREVLRRSGSPHDVLARRDVLRIEFHHRSIGDLALGFSSAGDLGESHPLEVAIYAGALSLPAELWTKSDRQSAKRLIGWMERLLLNLADRTEAHYGGIGIEAVFPTPAVVASSRRSKRWPTTWFWSAQLGSRAAIEENELVSGLDHDAVSRSDAGTLYRAWQPWREPRTDEAGLEQVVGFIGRFLEKSG